ncbi:MAG: peptide deformylase [Planctomycetota bacterium]|nr:peptide deformylase [Planctomycetota bacterium]
MSSSADVKSLSIVHHPAAVLRKRAKDIAAVDETVRAVAAKMLDIMRDEEGIGLAAPQVGLSWRMFVIDIPESDERSAESELPSATQGPVVFINPVLNNPQGAVEPMEEGCLSLPEIRGEVLRPPVITVTAKDVEGQQFTITASGLLARCIQHENDHLDGVLIIDKMTQLSRMKVRQALKDLERGG